jgi:hypothetical protein
MHGTRVVEVGDGETAHRPEFAEKDAAERGGQARTAPELLKAPTLERMEP